MQSKIEIRKKIQKKIKMLSPDFLKNCKALHLELLPFFKKCNTVFAYISLVDEFPTKCFLKDSHNADKTIGLPKVVRNELEFRKVLCDTNGVCSPLEKAAFNIFEPNKEAELLFSFEKQAKNLLPLLILAPGRAFSKTGVRLGRGGGFYDRFFTQLDFLFGKNNPNILRVGICFFCQIVEFLPQFQNDKLVDMLISEKGFFLTDAGRKKNL